MKHLWNIPATVILGVAVLCLSILSPVTAEPADSPDSLQHAAAICVAHNDQPQPSMELAGAVQTYGSDIEALRKSLTSRSGHDAMDVAAHEGAAVPAVAVHLSRHVVLIHRGNEAWAAQTTQHVEQAREQFYRAMNEVGFELKEITEPLVWIYFAHRDDFVHYATSVDHEDMSWSQGYYSARTNRVAMIFSEADRHDPAHAEPDPDIEHSRHMHNGGNSIVMQHASIKAGPDADLVRTRHEAAHQFAFNSGLQTRGVMYPLWVSEGLATYFECMMERDHSPSGNPMRLQHLLEAQTRGDLLPLHDFILVTRIPLGNPEQINAHYAQAWGLFHFLMTTRHDELRRYLTLAAGQRRGWRHPQALQAEFIASFGSIDSLQDAWSQYLAALPPVAEAE